MRPIQGLIDTSQHLGWLLNGSCRSDSCSIVVPCFLSNTHSNRRSSPFIVLVLFLSKTQSLRRCSALFPGETLAVEELVFSNCGLDESSAPALGQLLRPEAVRNRLASICFWEYFYVTLVVLKLESTAGFFCFVSRGLKQMAGERRGYAAGLGAACRRAWRGFREA